MELDFGDGGPTGALDFLYDTSDATDAASLDLLAWVSIVRMEVYEVVDAELRFAFAHGVRLPDVRARLSNAELRSFPGFNWLERSGPTTPVVLGRMKNVERVQFELIRRGETCRAAGETSAAIAYEEYLKRLDESSRSEASGIPSDHSRIALTRRKLLQELSLVPDPVDDIVVDYFGPDRGYAQLQFIQDEPARFVCSVAFSENETVGARLLTLAEQDYANGGLKADEEGLDELNNLGLTSLVLSPSGSLFARPVHEDFMDEGFDQVSYAHRAGVVAAISPLREKGQSILLAGWAGATGSADHLDYLNVELSAIEKIYSQSRSELTQLTTLPPVVHLAGHAQAGRSPTDHWLRAAESGDALVTPARVLLDADASGTELVYLSACSTGRGEFGLRSVMDAIPLDVAFLERGAKCVLSTVAPVNDIVATVFAIAFHAAWRGGASIWEAYMDARSAASTGTPSAVVLATLDSNWERWAEDLQRASLARPDDWMLYRLSGRHW